MTVTVIWHEDDDHYDVYKDTVEVENLEEDHVYRRLIDKVHGPEISREHAFIEIDFIFSGNPVTLLTTWCKH